MRQTQTRHPWGCARGTSYNHFGMRYKPPGGSIYICDPSKDKGCPDHEIAEYDTGRDLVLLPCKNGSLLKVPAVEFYGRYDGDFWDERRRLLGGFDSGTGGRGRRRDDFGEDWREGGYGADEWVGGIR